MSHDARGTSCRAELDAVVVDVETPHGLARVHLHHAEKDSLGMLVLGHGAGGGIGARDLVAAARAGRSVGVLVALVEQPYRVAGRRSPAPARQLDAAWVAVAGHLRATIVGAGTLVAGGRSSGARVACRTAEEVGTVGVLCLAFPLRPPGREDAASRLPELESVSAPVLVVQGARDPFGIPPAGAGRTVVEVAGDHSLRSDLGSIEAAVSDWLHTMLRGRVSD